MQTAALTAPEITDQGFANGDGAEAECRPSSAGSKSTAVKYGEHTLSRQPEHLHPYAPGDATDNGEPVSAEFLATINEYFSHFCKPDGEHGNCIKCGKPQAGFLGAFRWGLAHGHGQCSSCGWPATAYHFLKDEAGKRHRIVMVLQVHPDHVEVRSRKKTEA